MRLLPKRSLAACGLVLAVLLFIAAACAPQAVPTPTPTKAPAAAPTTAPAAATKPTTEPTKPAASATTAAPKAASGTPIKIGVVLPLSGAMQSFGALVRIAVNLAIEDINTAGGINGAPVQLVIEDSPFDPKQAVTVVRKLAEQDKVFAIVGPYSTGEFQNAAPLANDLKLSVISAPTVAGITTDNRPYPFQFTLSNEMTTPNAVDAYKKKFPNVKKIVLTGDTKQAATQAMVNDAFPKILKAKGLDLIETVPFESSMTDFSPVVTKIKGLNPDGVAFAATIDLAILFAKEYQRQGVKAPVLSSAHPIGGPFVESAGSAADGWIMGGMFNWEDPNPKIQSFVKGFYERAAKDRSITPAPTHVSNEGLYYDMTTIVAEVMRKAGVKADTPLQQARDAIKDGLTSLRDYPALTAKVSMGPTGEAVWQGENMPVLTSVNGKWVIVK